MDVLAITTTFTSLAVVIVALRLWTRFRLAKTPGWDDLLIGGALIVDLAFFAFVLGERHYGLGKAFSALHPRQMQKQLLFLWLSIPFYNLTLILTKFSALFLFLRIFRSHAFLIPTYTIMAFLMVSGLWIVLSAFFFCVPIHDFWSLSPKAHKDHCLPGAPVWVSNAAIQIFTDLVILGMPLPLLWNLQITRRLKVGILLVFGFGIFVIATSSARLYELSTMIGHGDFNNPHANVQAVMWSSLEANVSIICACLPPLHPLLSRLFSFCFLPQPVNSSSASTIPLHSTSRTISKILPHTTQFTAPRKPSIYEHGDSGVGTDSGVFHKGHFYAGTGSYSANISRVVTNEETNDDAVENGRGFGLCRS
ncbi:hypothetical protein NUU61_000750 [Penicillium alfredii]|uniref:Rhodopsin domain-containing protein n=1 Tax=Penicillium alfredii TaxID=1506179 RepID=A0A9W9KRB8_9EURO|nr:uncharacterized protein NUU61_000750 [Penicillium alfredii]KAJ5114991.1 hypothetical protein NUU61_000750 [Penicillium alfredii]